MPLPALFAIAAVPLVSGAHVSLGLDASTLWTQPEVPAAEARPSATDAPPPSRPRSNLKLEPLVGASPLTGFWRSTGPYLEEDSTFLTFGGGAAVTGGSATDYELYGAWSKFLVDDVELSFELRALYYHQEGDDAVGISPLFVIRWHLLHTEPEQQKDPAWTGFLEVGIGFQIESDDVPEGGTSFNAAPRIGAGLTRRLTDDGVRLIAGVYWHHISNARIIGQDDNPSRDGAMIHAGVVFPF